MSTKTQTKTSNAINTTYLLKRLVYTYVFFLPLSESLSLLEGATVSKVLGYVIISVWINDLMCRQCSRICINKDCAILLMYFIFSMLFCVVTIDSVDSGQGIWQLFKNLFFLVILNSTLCQSDWKQLVQSLICGSLLASVIVLLNINEVTAADNMRATIEGINQNDIALVLACSATMLFVKSYQRSILYVFPFVLGLFAIVATGSRGAMLSLLFACMLSLCLTPKKYNSKRLGATVLIILGSLYGIVLAVPSATVMRILETGDKIRAMDLTKRQIFWKESLDYLKESPIIGTGEGTYKSFMQRRIGLKKTAHNTYLLITTEKGIGGIMLFLIIVIRALINVHRSRQAEREMILCGLLCLLFGMNALSWQYNKVFWFMTAMGLFRSYPIKNPQ